jgi:hypothetical protein
LESFACAVLRRRTSAGSPRALERRFNISPYSQDKNGAAQA